MRYRGKDLTGWVKPPWFYNPLRNQIDAIKLKQSGYGICVFCIYAPFRLPPWESYLEEFRKQVTVFKNFVTSCSDFIVHARSSEEVKSALEQGKIAAVLAIEGGHMVEDPSWLEEMKNEGVFYITLVHFIERRIGTTCLSMRKRRRGLKDFGRDVLFEMKRLGIVPDLAHCSEKTMRDVLDIHDGPVIFSHTGARRFSPMHRNIPDDVASEIFRRGGLVGIIYCTYYLKRHNLFGNSRLVVDTAEHFLTLGGENGLCIGSDMDGFIVTPSDLKDISQTPVLVENMEKILGRSVTEKIILDNVMRFLELYFH